MLFRSDDMWMGNTTQDPGEYRDLAHYTGNTYSAGNCCQNFWQYRYKGILRCNVAIDRIPAVEFTDESLRDRYVAEAKEQVNKDLQEQKEKAKKRSEEQNFLQSVNDASSAFCNFITETTNGWFLKEER